MKPSPAAQPDKPEAEATGLPGFRSWRQVYIFVFGSFVAWVVLLLILTRIFS